MGNLTLFLVQWGLTSLSLWVASYIFSGLRFADGGSLIIAALLLGFANAIVKPLLILFTLPLTVVTMGLFLLCFGTHASLCRSEWLYDLKLLDSILRQHLYFFI
jgi:uncharacterized membrane protein YvlD (DUF360 family)